MRRLLLKSGTELALSAVSITEIAIRNSIGKLEASGEAVTQMITDLQFAVLPFSAAGPDRDLEL